MERDDEGESRWCATPPRLVRSWVKRSSGGEMARVGGVLIPSASPAPSPRPRRPTHGGYPPMPSAAPAAAPGTSVAFQLVNERPSRAVLTHRSPTCYFHSVAHHLTGTDAAQLRSPLRSTRHFGAALTHTAVSVGGAVGGCIAPPLPFVHHRGDDVPVDAGVAEDVPHQPRHRRRPCDPTPRPTHPPTSHPRRGPRGYHPDVDGGSPPHSNRRSAAPQSALISIAAQH